MQIRQHLALGRVALLAAVMMTLSACETPPSQVEKDNAAVKPAPAVVETPKPTPTPEQIAQQEAESVAQRALKEGVALYNAGDYNLAIKRLSSNDITQADKTIQLEALKYTAFSYCVTGRAVLCRQHFEKAFKLDRSFDLAPGEKGHPLWGPVFERVKKNLK